MFLAPIKFSEIFQPLIWLKDQFCFKLAFMLQARFTVGGAVTILAVESDDFLQSLIRAVDVFVFNIQNRVDPVFLHEEAETVLKPIPGEERTVVKRFLTIDIELGRP